MLTYSHSGAVFANTSVQNHMEVVVAGVEGPAADANDGEDVHLHSDEGQLRKHMKVKLVKRHKLSKKKCAPMKAAGMPSVMGGQSNK